MTMRALFFFALIACVSAVQAQETSWPQELVSDDGAVVLIYQPQVEVFTGNSIEARAAVSVKTAATGDVPVFGAVWIEAKLDTNRDTRTAVIRDIEISDVRFADASDAETGALAEFIETKLENSSIPISVDQLLADLDAAEGAGQADLQHTPPKMILSTEPAMLVSIDGEPVFQGIDNTHYERVVNSPFLIVRGGLVYYLYVGSNAWFEASDAAGPWRIAASVPQDVKGFVEPAEDDGIDLSNTKIIIATEPTELLVSDGPPMWAPVEGMDLCQRKGTTCCCPVVGTRAKDWSVSWNGRMCRTTNCPNRSAIFRPNP